MAEIELRPVGADDWRQWREIRLRSLLDTPNAFGSTYRREIAFTEDDWRTRLGSDSPAVLALDGDEPVGMGAGFCDREGWMHVVAMWVDPARRGQGVGRRVLEHLLGWAEQHGLRTHLDVTVGNDGARTAYERSGFVATGEIRPLREGSAHRVERMVLPPEPRISPC